MAENMETVHLYFGETKGKRNLRKSSLIVMRFIDMIGVYAQKKESWDIYLLFGKNMKK